MSAPLSSNRKWTFRSYGLPIDFFIELWQGFSCGHNFLCLAIGKTIPNYNRGADLAPDGLSFLSLGTTHSLHSGSLLQLIQRFIHAVWERSIPSKLSSNLLLHISKLMRVHACALRLEYLIIRSFRVILTKSTARTSSMWTVNCPAMILTYWTNATSWHTNV